MNVFWAAGIPLLSYAAAFLLYGKWLKGAFGLCDRNKTPARLIDDGRDFVPTRPAVLLGQHFAAIAAVGPIAGPIIAGVEYGWLPGMLWIILGAVFIGAVHDFAALVLSVRHGARSVGDVFRTYLGERAALLFSAFIWLSLLYVIVVFTDLTAAAFASRPELGERNFGPGVATSSLLYLGLAVAMGICLERYRMPLLQATLLFVPAVFVAIWLGQRLPIVFPGSILQQQRLWGAAILSYCFVASTIPLWLLLQPRGYLGGFILYSTFAAGMLGLLLGGREIAYPSFSWLAMPDPATIPPIFPLLFTTIACGACSGFHGLVASGTTSKQLRSETDAVMVGYGGMLLESLVAVIALATVMTAAPGSQDLKLGPDEIYARGLARFMGAFGIPFAAGVAFGKLAFATFIYDTLDVATRLGRYVLQETFGLKGRQGAFWATLATVLPPLLALFCSFHDPSGKPLPLWKLFWPAFGASNQLLAAMTLAGITVWLKREGKNWWVTGIPAVFMSAVTLSSLTLIALPWLKRTASGGPSLDPVGTTALVLMALGLAYLCQAARSFLSRENPTA